MISNKNIIFALVLCVFILAVYSSSLKNNFVLDDEFLIVKSPLIKAPKLLTQIFNTGLYDYSDSGAKNMPYDKMYRPLQLLSYAIDYKIWGLNPSGFHLTNIIIHVLNSILIYFLFSLVSDNLIAKITSIIFAVHPINVSVVSYISGRADLLVSFFMLLSMVSFFKFIKYNLKKYYAVSLVLATLALFCRENSLILFLFILSILFIAKTKSNNFLFVVPFILLDFFYILLRFIIFGYHGLTLHAAIMPLGLRLVNFLNIVPRYLLVLVLPLDLHLLRTTFFIKQLFDYRVFFSIAFILLCIYLIKISQKSKLLLFGMLWFLIGILPVFFFLDGYPGLNQAMMAESWLYLSSAGFFFLFAYLVKAFKRIGKILLILVTIFYAVLTFINNTYWKDNIALYKNILKYIPDKNPLRQNLINEYLQKGLYEDARVEIKQFSADYPEISMRYILQGDYYYHLNQIPAAIKNYENALIINKYNFKVYYNLSLCFEKLKQSDKAVDFALKSIKINPYYFDALNKLGDLYSEKKDNIEAIKYYKRALDINPGNNALGEKIKNAK